MYKRLYQLFVLALFSGVSSGPGLAHDTHKHLVSSADNHRKTGTISPALDGCIRFHPCMNLLIALLLLRAQKVHNLPSEGTVFRSVYNTCLWAVNNIQVHINWASKFSRTPSEMTKTSIHRTEAHTHFGSTNTKIGTIQRAQTGSKLWTPLDWGIEYVPIHRTNHEKPIDPNQTDLTWILPHSDLFHVLGKLLVLSELVSSQVLWKQDIGPNTRPWPDTIWNYYKRVEMYFNSSQNHSSKFTTCWPK